MSDKPEKIEVDRQYLENLLEAANKAAGRAEAAEKKADAAQKLADSKGGTGIETAAQRLAKDNHRRMADEPKEKQEAKIHLSSEPSILDDQPLVNQDKCPHCLIKHKELYLAAKKAGDTYEVLDLTNAGKYSCRRCGKHWHPWAIFPEDGSVGPLPYSIHLERGDKDKVEELEKLRQAKAGLPVSIK